MTDDFGALRRLATYGTLAPGRPNHEVVARLGGRWLCGVVRGRLVERGWGAAMGSPGIVLDPMGGAVRVDLLEADALIDDWARLDAFEGDQYRRRAVEVALDGGGTVAAQIYEIVAED